MHSNHAGVHLLTSTRIASQLVHHGNVAPGDLVLDLGAGTGAITEPLTGTGATVLAVERDRQLASTLRRRLGDRARVIVGDVRTIPLPRKDFLVVASIPYAVSSVLFRRLLGAPDTALRRAALIVEWGFAKRLTTATAARPETAWWAGRFQVELAARVPKTSFAPPPAVGSAMLTIRRRPGRTATTDRALWTLLNAAARHRGSTTKAMTRAVLGSRNPHRVLAAADIDPAADPLTVPAARWAQLAKVLAEDRSLHWPSLPAALRDRPRRR